MSNSLSTVDRSSLRKLETVIERGMATFVEVGNALKAIRDEKLYREQFKTFDKYVQERWGMAKQRAYQLIDAAEIKCEMSTMVDKIPRLDEIKNERQMRELADVPTENIPQVIERASEIAGDLPITAKVLREAKQGLCESDSENESNTVDAVSISSVVRDELDRDVPAVLRDKFSVASQLAALGRKIDQLKREAVELADYEGGWFVPVQQIEIASKELKGMIVDSSYWTACPRCKGKGCKRCEDAGFIPRSRRNMLSAEDKELLGL